jgi:hypothetical protein
MHRPNQIQLRLLAVSFHRASVTPMSFSPDQCQSGLFLQLTPPSSRADDEHGIPDIF